MQSSVATQTHDSLAAWTEQWQPLGEDTVTNGDRMHYTSYLIMQLTTSSGMNQNEWWLKDGIKILFSQNQKDLWYQCVTLYAW